MEQHQANRRHAAVSHVLIATVFWYMMAVVVGLLWASWLLSWARR